MRIALLGYGRMGKSIEAKALEKGHEISFRIGLENAGDLSKINKDNTDVAIDFSLPKIAFSHIQFCLQSSIPIVSGTTGWLDQFEEAKNICLARNGGFLYASNFSVGMNLFFDFNEKLAKIMGQQDAYSCSLEEIHHVHKLDAPSGTAISLAEQIIPQHPSYDKWILAPEPSKDALPITAIRKGEVPGTHTIQYQSSFDKITMTHEAFSRDGFALGAVMASEWLVGKQGIFSMKDVLGL